MRNNYILQTLQEKGIVTFKPHGNSMTPKIYSGDEVTVKQVPIKIYRIGDAAYCKVKGNIFLHLITAINETENKFQISNNHGHVNGWASEHNMFGILIKVKNKIIITEDELQERSKV